jgi:hypothetical protein
VRVMIKQRFRRLVWVLVPLYLALLFFPAQAQTRNTIVYGQTVSGRITNDTFRTVYTFQGQQGEIIDAQLKRTNGDLDPMLILLDSANNLVASDDDSDAAYNAMLLSVALPHDGLYFLIASRFGQDRGLTAGAYTLTLNRVGIASDPNLEGGATPLRYGDSVVLDLGNDQYQHIFTFGALRGDIINVAMQRISGDLDPTLILADAKGNVLLISDDDPNSPGSLDAAIANYRITKSGNYLLAATRFGGASGASHGGYSLKLDRLPPEALGNTPERAIMLEYNTVASGQIDSDHVKRYYLIEAKQGDVLHIEATRTAGNLDPVLELDTADMRPLTAHDAGVRGRYARITAYRVIVDGEYILVVSRFNRETGATSGNYQLTIENNPGK